MYSLLLTDPELSRDFRNVQAVADLGSADLERRRFSGHCGCAVVPNVDLIYLARAGLRKYDTVQYLYTGFKACPTCPAVQFRDWSSCLLFLPRQAAFELGSLVVLVRWFSTGKDAERGTRVVKTG